MTLRTGSLLALVLSAQLLGQVSTPPVKVETNTAPKNATQADIQDVRVLTKAPDDPFEYERMGLGSMAAGLLPRARKFFERSWVLGNLPTAAYNLACVDLRESRQADALAELNRAIEAGFDDVVTLEKDPDMAPLREKPEFSKFVEGAKKNLKDGDAAVVSQGLFLAPPGPPKAILILIHDASSDPLRASGPFVDEAKTRGFYLAVPRGPSRLGKHGFGWGLAGRSFVAIEAAVAAAKAKAGAAIPVYVVGLGRGGTLAYANASTHAGFAGIASIGGPFDRNAGGPTGASGAGLKGARLFLGVAADAPKNLVSAFHRGASDLRGLGLTATIREWPGPGPTLPRDVRVAVKDTLDAVSGANAAAKKG
jgi:hypothetical protein